MFLAIPRIVVFVAYFASVLGAQNVTIDDLGTSVVLSPLNAWAWSNQATGENNGTFSFSNDERATVTFTFPSE